jgi:hypothetical protein
MKWFEGGSSMHRAKCVDYAVLLDGEMEMHLDDSSGIKWETRQDPDFGWDAVRPC